MLSLVVRIDAPFSVWYLFFALRLHIFSRYHHRCYRKLVGKNWGLQQLYQPRRLKSLPSRACTRSWGGTNIYVLCLCYAYIAPNECLPLGNSSVLVINLKGNRALPVGVIYRLSPSSTDFDDELCHLLENISYHNSDFKIICGDFALTSITDHASHGPSRFDRLF